MPGSDENRLFREPLPKGCPPWEAREITTQQTVFRLVRTDPPTDSDFRSQRAENPNNPFRGVSECRARGLSVYSNIRHAENRLKTPRFRGSLICEVKLDRGAGYISKTGYRAHFTWWPFASFPIVTKCQVVRR